ncbi:MAG: hypothetical protein DME36_13825 [Verrucomicrobia bacterium]|nr:MAG: hypothetical protein DME36_13825 [Verrucomicrobiota bacterium]
MKHKLMKHKLLLFLPCAVVVFGFGARLAPFGQDPSPNQSKRSAVNVSAVAKTTPQASRLPPFSFPVQSTGDGNDYPGGLVKLRGLLTRSLASHSVAAYDTARGAECLYSISAHTLECSSSVNHQMPPIIVGPENIASGYGTCQDNPQCTGRKYMRRGPVEPGEYKMKRDARPGHPGRFVLEPIPAKPGWRLRLPSWMPGSLRGGFLLGLGSFTHGCITVLKEDPTASAQYGKMLQLLEAEHGSNYLRVIR